MTFERRTLSDPVAAVREEFAPEAVVLDAAVDFESLDPTRTEQLLAFVESVDPDSYPDAWFPAAAPAVLDRRGGESFVVGLPGDGSVTWTRQTTPPVVLVKRRVEGSPASFVEFLVAEALVELGLELPEGFPPFFGDRYPDLEDATTLDPAGTYQVAAALFDAWTGLHTREEFREWDGPLGEAWDDAGQRLVGRIDGLHGELARGEVTFPAATELACSGVKHDLELPAPFSALDTGAYRERGAPYAVAWAEKTFEELSAAKY